MTAWGDFRLFFKDLFFVLFQYFSKYSRYIIHYLVIFFEIMLYLVFIPDNGNSKINFQTCLKF
jgi:hypothetical protein